MNVTSQFNFVKYKEIIRICTYFMLIIFQSTLELTVPQLRTKLDFCLVLIINYKKNIVYRNMCISPVMSFSTLICHFNIPKKLLVCLLYHIYCCIGLLSTGYHLLFCYINIPKKLSSPHLYYVFMFKTYNPYL